MDGEDDEESRIGTRRSRELLREWRDRNERRLRELNVKWWEEKVREMVGEGERGKEEKVRKRREDRQGRERKVA